jgi:mono/diheme cytochrome c family protein
MARDDIEAMVAFVRSVPPTTTSDFSVRSTPAPVSHKDGVTASLLGKKIFEGACVSCHGWTGESAVSPFATLTGSAAANDPSATNVAQVVIGGTRRLTPDGALPMPSFGHAYSDDEIAAVANYVTARFGAKASSLKARDVAKLRDQVAD